MTFGEAIEALKEGKHVTREVWGGYWFFSKNPDMRDVLPDKYERAYGFKNGLIVAVLKDGGGCAPAMAYQSDMLAEDWKIVE